MKRIGIVGGGVIGLCAAYYLRKKGHKVIIFEQGDPQNGCSWGNAGMIVPSHIIPLAAPGMIAQGIRWMFDSQSPFYVRPRLSKSLLKWGYLFYRHATHEHVAKAAPALKEISLYSKALYKEMVKELPFDIGYNERGLLMLYQTKETEAEETETVKLANKHGIEAHILSPEEVQKLEPDVRVSVRGGVYFPGDAHLVPQELIAALIYWLKQHDVTILSNTPVTEIEVKQNKIQTIEANSKTYDLDEVILSAGSWSGIIGSKLRIHLPLQAGKGYSFTLEDVKKNTRIPSIFLEARVAVTPMGNALRFGGTMEISGIDHSINMKRVKGIADSVSRYYPDMNVTLPAKETVWHGLRPCSPDGLPYIGRHPALKNLIIATGHSMMGVSLAPATGKLVSDIVDDEMPVFSIESFFPDRFR